MNKPLLKEIIKAIEAEPRRFHMAMFINLDDEKAPCGTTACIAGFAVILDLMKKQEESWTPAATRLRWYDTSSDAKKLLGLTSMEASDLFYQSNWPISFERAYHKARSRRAKAKVAIARIRHFMRTGR